MDSHNTKVSFAYHKTPVVTDDAKKDADVVKHSLSEEAALAIADDAEGGCDPYNSTGQHVILQAKLRRKD